MPAGVRRTLRKLGADVNVARRKRGLSVAHVTEAAGISASTLRRLERGEAAVSVGALAMVLLSLGEDKRLGALLDAAADPMGLALSHARLPKRITTRAKREAGL